LARILNCGLDSRQSLGAPASCRRFPIHAVQTNRCKLGEDAGWKPALPGTQKCGEKRGLARGDNNHSRAIHQAPQASFPMRYTPGANASNKKDTLYKDTTYRSRFRCGESSSVPSCYSTCWAKIGRSRPRIWPGDSLVVVAAVLAVAANVVATKGTNRIITQAPPGPPGVIAGKNVQAVSRVYFVTT
jgi:hypothetical protein